MTCCGDVIWRQYVMWEWGLTKWGYVGLKRVQWEKHTYAYSPSWETLQLLPPYLLSQQRPGLQGFLRLVLLFDRQQRLEELRWLRGEDLEGAGVEKCQAVWNQTCVGTFDGSNVANQTVFLTQKEVRTQCISFTFVNWIKIRYQLFVINLWFQSIFRHQDDFLRFFVIYGGKWINSGLNDQLWKELSD